MPAGPISRSGRPVRPTWPLLYLPGRVDAVPAPAGWQVATATADEVAAIEHPALLNPLRAVPSAAPA